MKRETVKAALELAETEMRYAGWAVEESDNPGRNAAYKSVKSALTLLDADEGAGCADDLRALGWSVAVHNDYRLSEQAFTFWLFTKDGSAIKGEGRTDAEALNQVRAALATKPAGVCTDEPGIESAIEAQRRIAAYVDSIGRDKP